MGLVRVDVLASEIARALGHELDADVVPHLVPDALGHLQHGDPAARVAIS
jgi:hypothetical protein